MSDRDSICASAEKLPVEAVGRFLSRIDKDGPIPSHDPSLGPCWLWTGTILKPWKYGQISIDNKRYLAHRISWLIHVGPLTAQVNHKCDNPQCVRPSHLYEGSQGQNMQDLEDRKRCYTNGAHQRAKLTPQIVREIRQRRTAGETLEAIGNRFGITKQNVSHVAERRTWVHVE